MKRSSDETNNTPVIAKKIHSFFSKSTTAVGENTTTTKVQSNATLHEETPPVPTGGDSEALIVQEADMDNAGISITIFSD
jgi:hypothetical protein